MNDFDVWLVIVVMGIGTYLIRFSFLGLIGGRKMPEWLLRHLRYVPVAVLPGLVAPLVAWPAATNGDPDPSRLAAATVAFGVGAVTRSTLGAIFAGMATLYLVQLLVS